MRIDDNNNTECTVSCLMGGLKTKKLLKKATRKEGRTVDMVDMVEVLSQSSTCIFKIAVIGKFDSMSHRNCRNNSNNL